ncbi:hypothetical protein PHLGIDRAFT_510813 [Phlebiopsis gigantea 11061_1 CR5-6]|uniref:F-box domain-containing protein n=1 Tax=Phlebiopsis gigantea (strain 11061_1 CR5-6) TaxID=745531 RepID=A0A0C3RZR3_PHLG1|nr:hypothetical protein PHLGIDRAFT_510813 [Phlebiopsis gigantea 11061_1 CR5-6]
MELSREIHHLIVRNVTTRADLVSLTTVSKRFQHEAERALYNTLHLRGTAHIVAVCHTLGRTPRLSRLVEALSIFVALERPEAASDDEDSDADSDAEAEAEADAAPLPVEFWDAVAAALRAVRRLRFLSIYFEQIHDTAQAWVLRGTVFQLRTFHCDFEWDVHLAAFLRTQTDAVDLCLADYRREAGAAGGETTTAGGTAAAAATADATMPQLAVLECTFSEAAADLVPDRPVARVKTCFSRSDADEKRAELALLLAQLQRSRTPLRALDLGDEAYDEDFTLLLLRSMGGPSSRFSELRYLGTLVLPVDGTKRVEFYARLMRFPRLRCVELEVSKWEPPPMTPTALRALTYELRIYCSSISRVIFVYDFDRALMVVEPDGACVLDPDAATDTLWREV